jgi:hypothetical protein
MGGDKQLVASPDCSTSLQLPARPDVSAFEEDKVQADSTWGCISRRTSRPNSPFQQRAVRLCVPVTALPANEHK